MTVMTEGLPLNLNILKWVAKEDVFPVGFKIKSRSSSPITSFPSQSNKTHQYLQLLASLVSRLSNRFK